MLLDAVAAAGAAEQRLPIKGGRREQLAPDPLPPVILGGFQPGSEEARPGRILGDEIPVGQGREALPPGRPESLSRNPILAATITEPVRTRRQQIELSRVLEDQLIDAAPPVLANCSGALQDGEEITVVETEAADVGSGEPQILRGGDHEGRALQPLRFLLGLQPADQFIGDHAARQFAALHHARDGGRRNVHVGQHRNVAQTLAAQILLQFIQLAQVEAQLRDDETGAGRDLQLELVELHHLVRLADLERTDHRPGEEIERRGENRSRAEFVVDAAAHGFDQLEDEHGVEIVYRLAPAGEAVLLRVARQGQDVLIPEAGQSIEAGLEKRAVPVFARHVRDRREPALRDEGGEGLREEGGVAAGKVGDADHLDSSGFLGGVFDKRLGLGEGMVAAQNQLSRTDELAVLQRRLEITGIHRKNSS